MGVNFLGNLLFPYFLLLLWLVFVFEPVSAFLALNMVGSFLQFFTSGSVGFERVLLCLDVYPPPCLFRIKAQHFNHKVNSIYAIK